MRLNLPILFFLALLAACAAPTPSAAPPHTPTIAPVGLAQTTNAPTATPDKNAPPTATRAIPPTAIPIASPTSANTATPLPTSAPTQAPLTGPAVLSRINLLNLPGEGRSPVALARLGDTYYTANRGSSNLGVIREGRVSEFIPLGAGPSAVIADELNNRVYAATYETPTLSIIENARIVNQAPAGGRINALALDGADLYVALDNDALIERYDAVTLKKKDELKLSEGFGVSDLVLDKPRNRLYAGEYGKIVSIDLAQFRELEVFATPYLYSRFAVNPKDGSLWAGAYDDKTSQAYIVGYAADGKELGRVTVGADLTAATFDDADRLYVLDRFRNFVYVVDTANVTVGASIPVNESPSAALYDAGRKSVLVTSQDNDNVGVIDIEKLELASVIPLAARFNALEASPALGRLYAANGSDNSVYVISGDQVQQVIKTGINPEDLAVDAEGKQVFVAASAHGELQLIRETDLAVESLATFTRSLETVAVDATNRKLFAGADVYDLDPFALEGTMLAKGLTLNSTSVPLFERVNPAIKKVYTLASNSVPGSNSRLTLFRFNYEDWANSELLGSTDYGNTTALAIDPETNNLFATNTHPLAYLNGLDVFDAQDKVIRSVRLDSRTTDMLINPATHHLFLAHAQSYPAIAGRPAARDNTIEILDTRTLGHVGTLEVNGDPWRLAQLGDKVYVVSFRDGTLSTIADVAVPAPPAPPPTLTPYPTSTPLPQGSPQAAITPECFRAPGEVFVERWQQLKDVIGCAHDALSTAQFAVQTFRDGYMFDDLRDGKAQKIYALFPNRTYLVFADTWQEGSPERACEGTIPEGRFHPKRGFGKVWCENPRVQEQLPGAVAEEALTTLQIQTFNRGMMWADQDLGVFVLFEDGTWR